MFVPELLMTLIVRFGFQQQWPCSICGPRVHTRLILAAQKLWTGGSKQSQPARFSGVAGGDPEAHLRTPALGRDCVPDCVPDCED